MKKKVITMLFVMALAAFIPHFNVYAAETDNKFTVNNSSTTSSAMKIENYNNQKDLQNALIGLKEGETITVPLHIKELNNSGQDNARVKRSVVDMGNAGTVTFTRRSDYLAYAMNITKFYNKVEANGEIMDESSGQSQGTFPITSARGTVPYTALEGHKFSFSFNGYAYLFGSPVVSLYAQVFWIN